MMLIQKYSIELLELCEDSERLSKILVTDWLEKYMFGGESTKKDDIEKTVEYFSNYTEHLLHSRPLTLSNYQNLRVMD